jgi:hypothetical protein
MTTEPAIPTKADLIESLRVNGRECLEKLRALPAEDFEQGRYENGWNGREILAHIASIEWTYKRLLEVAQEAPAAPPPGVAPGGAGGGGGTEAPDPPPHPKRPPQGGDQWYKKTQFERNRAGTIAAVEAANEALLTRPIRSAGGITGALASVLNAVAVQHVASHTNDIVGQR